MRGYLSVIGADTGAISLDSRVEIYRDPDNSHTVIARTQEREYDLGINDVTVSRRKNETAPILIEPCQSRIEIHNKQNTNSITVVSEGERTELTQGLTETVRDTAKITVGYQTEFQLKVKEEVKTEINVDGDVDGDVVAGNQSKTDERTQIVDSVVNRSNVGRDNAASVEDSIVNRSNISGSSEQDSADGSDTQNHCEKHNILYEGDVCPKCLQEQSPQKKESAEAKFCMYCGATITKRVTACPDCGKDLDDATR